MNVAIVLLFAAYAYGCGTPTYEPSVSRAMKAEDARPHSWPWQISLQHLDGSTYLRRCAGTLLAPNWVITAATCIEYRTYRVVLGEFDLSKEEGYEQIRNVEKIILHPQWDHDFVNGNDIAMIKLASPAVLNDHVQPSCLPESGEIVPDNYPCYITSWGGSNGGPVYYRLRQALFPAMGHSVCSNGWESIVTPMMICAYLGTDSRYYADTGSSLNCRGGDGRWYVQGVTSFALMGGSNAGKTITVSTRISSFTEWISDTMLRH